MCTHLRISVPTNPGSATPRSYVTARAMEMPGVMEQNLYVVPSNQSFPLRANPAIETPLTWTNQYGFVAIGELPYFIDGMNSEGLSVGAQWLAPDTEYPPIGAQPNKVSFLDFPAWILGKFATVSDFLQALPNINVVGPPPPPNSASNNKSNPYVPLHYIVTDSTGASAVIEFIEGKTVVYGPDECNGVMTNWPVYGWHLTNVKNYFNLTLDSTSTSITGAGNPVGGGMVGLPGDSLSTSRFVKATVLSQPFNPQGLNPLPPDGTGWLPAPGALPGSTTQPGFSGPEQTAVVVALQLVQMCMGTPYGMLLQQALISTTTTTTTETITTYGDYTMWTTVRDHNNRKYYFIPALSAVLSMIDLTSLDFTNAPGYPNNLTIPVMPQGNAAWCSDVTANLTSQRATSESAPARGA